MVDFNPYIQIQPVQQVREIRNLGEAQATGQVVAPAFSLGKALGELAPSLAEASRQNVKEEEQKRRDEQTAQIQLIAEQETEAKLGELIQQRVKTGELPPGYSPYMMDLLERQAGRRAFRDYRREADQALRAFNDPDYAGDPDEVLANIQAEVLGRYGAADQGAKFLAEFVTLRDDVRDAFISNAVKVRSSARQEQGLSGFADDVQVAVSEFGDDPRALNSALANLMQEAAGSSVFVGMPKGKLAEIMGAAMKGEVERLIKQEDYEEARTLIDNFRVLNPRSRRLNGTPGDDESTDIRQANSFAYDHGTLIATLEASLEDSEAQAERRDGGQSLAKAESTAASVLSVIESSKEAREWMDGLPADISGAELERATEQWLNEVGFNLDRVASLGVDLNERVKTIVLSGDLGATVQKRIQAERITEFRSGGVYEGIMEMPLDYPVQAAETAMRREARAAGISEPGVQGLIEVVRNNRDRRRGEVVSPTSEVLNQKSAAEMTLEFFSDTRHLPPDEFTRVAAAKYAGFLELGPRFAIEFKDRVDAEVRRRKDISRQRLEEKRYPVQRKGQEAAELVTNELSVLLEKEGSSLKEASAEALREINKYRTEFEEALTADLRAAAYDSPEEEISERLADVMRDYAERAKAEAPEFARGLMRGRAEINTGRSQTTGVQTVPIKSTFGGLFAADNDDINDYLAPLQTAAPDRTAVTAWQEVWKKEDVNEYKLEVTSARQVVRKAKSGDYAVTLENGKFVPSESAWWDMTDIAVEDATNAAAMIHIDDILHIYDSNVRSRRGRDIHAGFGRQRLDSQGVEIDPRLLNPEKVPVLSLAALEDPAAQQVIQDYNEALDDNRIIEAEDIIKEWLAGDSISAKEYKLLLPQYQQNPGPVWARQEQFYRAWEATRNN